MPHKKPSKDAIVRRLRLARKNAGFTQEEAAQRVGTLRQAVVMVEAGKRKLMALEMVKFCRLYNVTPDWMLGFCR